jgi:hypothetical protein
LGASSAAAEVVTTTTAAAASTSSTSLSPLMFDPNVGDTGDGVGSWHSEDKAELEAARANLAEHVVDVDSPSMLFVTTESGAAGGAIGKAIKSRWRQRVISVCAGVVCAGGGSGVVVEKGATAESVRALFVPDMSTLLFVAQHN